MSRLQFIAILAYIPFISTSAGQKSNKQWPIYTNVRFQYAICYPEQLLPQGESPNSDGQEFIGPHNQTLLVFGRNAIGDNLSKDEQSAIADLKSTSGKLTYQIRRSSWYVISGSNQGNIFYAKTFFSHGQFKSFRFVYPSTEARELEQVVKKLTVCFSDLAESSVIHQ